MDTIQYRPFQDRALAAWAILRAKLQQQQPLTASERTLVANVFPGSGKTRLILSVLNDAYRKKLIGGALILVPRLILAEQLELDWQGLQAQFASPKMSEIIYRENIMPLLRQSEFGLVTTYQALVSQPDIFLNLIQSRTFGIVADEAQFLGFDPEKGGTRAAEVFKELAEHAQFSLIVSGTPYRSDNIPLVFGRYSKPDADGARSLLADVEAGYIEGVKERYLRQFEYRFQNAAVTWESLVSGDQITVGLEAAGNGLYDILTTPDFYQLLVDIAVEKIGELQMVWPEYCGLIGCADQRHARDVQRYIQATYPQLKVLLAISDEPTSRENLRRFKQGGYDLLITVGMVFIGFDHKPISVICSLNPVRDEGWNRQFFARGLRMAAIGDDRDDAQCLYAIVPDDPMMRKLVEDLRNESQRGLQEAETRASHGGGGNGAARSANTMIIANVQPTTIRVLGLDATFDLDDEEARRIDYARKAANIAAPLGALKSFLSNLGTMPAAVTPQPPPLPQTKSEIERKLRGKVAKLARRADALQSKPWGFTHSMLNRKMSKKPETEMELKDAIKWLKQTYNL